MRLSEDQFRAIWQSAAHDRAIGHEHFWERALSRRQFLGTAAAASGVAVTASLWVPGLAEAAAPGAGTPKPIPGTVVPGAPFHIKLPGAGVEPSAITDFNGFVAIADIEGTGTGTGSGLTFGADMRFMTGTFKGTDDRIHRGTFGFVWLDVFNGPVGTDQIHDFNPGIDPFPAGLFWTVAIPEDSVALNLGRGTASYRLSNFAMEDYGNIGNALSDGSSVPGVVSFDVEWSGVVERATSSDTSSQFSLSLVRTGASIAWSGSSSLGSFVSDAVTKVNFAQIAHETNGIFFGG